MEKNSRIVLVTGGSRGLGKDMALRLAGKGMNVVLTYHSKAEEAQNVVEQIENAGQLAAALHLDTGDLKSFDSFIVKLGETLTGKFKTNHIDFLINNAGFGRISPFAEETEEMFDALMNVHFKGVYFLTQKLLPVLNDGGGIVNVSSGLTRICLTGSSAYACMKGAVEVMTRYLAKELGPRGIRANVIAPGAIATDFNGAHVRNSKEVSKMISSVTALGRPGLAEDVGGVAAFLCTEDGRWINGQRIEVSGGMFV